MAGQPTIVSDYISLILRAIEDTQNDPARLRSLIYDVTRVSLGKQLLSNYRELGGGGLQKYVVDLEIAIKEAEKLSQQREKDTLATRLDVQLLGEAVSSSDGTAVAVVGEPDGTVRRSTLPDNTLPVPFQSTEFSREISAPLEPLRPIEIWEPAFGRKLESQRTDRPRKLELAAAGLIGIAIYGVIFVRSDLFPKLVVSYPGAQSQMTTAISTPSNTATSSTTAGSTAVNLTSVKSAASPQVLGFPLPTAYGVYAVSEGKLYELGQLQMRIPDPRVAISAMIQTPSHVSIPSGKLNFVIFRRDLASSAPMEVFVRVVAKVTRAIEFSGNGAPKTTSVEDQWAVRNKSYEFRVSPLGENPEIIILHPGDVQLTLSPGRYALVIGGQGYDFTVDGQVTDTAQCLERTEIVGGAVYSECRNLPKSTL
jgi:hypothetical protein